MSNKSYLGDSVYVDYDNCGYLVLTTDNGEGPSNMIALEPAVYEALVQYVDRLRKQIAATEREAHA